MPKYEVVHVHDCIVCGFEFECRSGECTEFNETCLECLLESDDDFDLWLGGM